MTPVSAPIPDGFLGLALEYSTIPTWAGSGSAPVDPVLVRLVRDLDPVGRPSVRIGGLSTDHSWWPAAGQAQPRGATYALTPSWARSARALAGALDAQLVLGLNLEAGRPALDGIEARDFLHYIGRRWIGALDIGNEPPLYSGQPYYHLLGGRVVPWYEDVGTPVDGRGATWGPRAYARQWGRALAALPRIPMAGPDTEQASWFDAFRRYVSPHSRVRILASHGYGLNNCVRNPASPAYPTVPNLLSDYAFGDLLPGLHRYIALAHRDGATFRIDEMGSITCNGRAGVANTMASALWLTSALLTVASAGVDGVNLHTFPGLTNELFDFTHNAGGWSATVRPMYYGALLFERAAPAGSRLVRVAAGGPPTLHAWATTGPGRAARVVLINDSLGDPVTAAVRPPAGFAGARAFIQDLGAASAYATGGVSLGGRSFGAQTATGVLGTPDPIRLPTSGRITLAPASAALITFER